MHVPDLAELPRLSRRGFIVLAVGGCAVAMLPGSLRRGRRLARRSLPVMGTIAEVAVIHADPRKAHEAIDAAMEELQWVERTMSRFLPDSDIGRANMHATGRPVRIEQATAAVLNEACRWAEASGGTFDPCLGAAIALWDVENRHQPPPAERIRALAGRRLYSGLQVEIEPKGGVVRFGDPDVAIDLGGIGKGYGVDRAVAALRARGIEQAFVNVGGDLYALGKSEDGDPWKVGIRSPADPTRIVDTLDASDAAIATSGDYLRFFEHGGRRYHHLLDPETGAPRVSTMHSITVMADRCVTADAAATALFGMSPAVASRVLAAVAPDARVVRTL